MSERSDRRGEGKGGTAPRSMTPGPDDLSDAEVETELQELMAVSSVLMVVTDVVYSPVAGALVAAVSVVGLGSLWLVLPLTRRALAWPARWLGRIGSAPG